jgi:hypothetical protein
MEEALTDKVRIRAFTAEPTMIPNMKPLQLPTRPAYGE